MSNDLTLAYIASDAQVCISTIQRLYSILKGEELDEKAEKKILMNQAGRQRSHYRLCIIKNTELKPLISLS